MLGSLNLRFHFGAKIAKIKYKTWNGFRIQKPTRTGTRHLTLDSAQKISVPSVDFLLNKLKIPYTEGYTCYRIKKCMLCSSQNNDSASTINTDVFINKKTGHFLCKKCKISGNWPVLYEAHDSLKKETTGLRSDILLSSCVKHDISQEWQEIRSRCCQLHSVNQEDFLRIIADFKLHHLDKKICSVLDIHFDKERKSLFFPMYYSGSIVGYKILDLNGHYSTYPRKDCPGLFTFTNNKMSADVIVLTDLKDFIALMSLNLSLNVVCLPYGAATLPQGLLPNLECYKKIILWLGAEYGAWQTSIQFAKKLNEKRCYLIHPKESQISASQAVSNNQNVNKIISNAQPMWHEFVKTFSSLREEVVNQLQSINELKGVSWNRFPKLTHILKGHRRGELTILTGPTGAGKTTFLSEYSLDLAMQGVNTLWGSFEVKNTRLVLTMLQQFSGVPIMEVGDVFNKWADKFENLPIYFMTFHGQHSLPLVMKTVDHCFYTYDIAHVIIDNVQFMIDISSDNKGMERFWVQDCIIQSFRRFATLNNCHVTLVIHPRKETDGAELSMSSIFGSAKASQEADNIMILQKASDAKIRLQICKNRFSGDLGSMFLNFNKINQRFAQRNDIPKGETAVNEDKSKLVTKLVNDQKTMTENLSRISF